MKLYMHPASTTSRPVLMLLDENGIEVEQQVVDLFTGEHLGEAFAKVNPNCLVPVLEDGDFRLTESSAILKYLADVHQTPDYPKDLKARARVNERMDWFNANLYKDLGYNVIYPQLFEHQKRPTEAGQRATIDWGIHRTEHWLGILDKHLLGPGSAYVCGSKLTIADYFCGCILELGKAIRCDYSAWPNVEAWLDRLRERPSWGKAHDTFYGYAASLKDKDFVAVG